MRKNVGPTGDLDPRALILDAYRIEGIGAADCRAIFLDWALGVAPERDMAADARRLLAHHGPSAPDHPMTAILRDSAARPAPAARRGGAAGRRARRG
ncbi:hypothetical protein [Pikeienuella sp. HZG-20]|uniref:hypothetical protein n=1 Tax=Paludibacillus litoralis TaxID=3133267 RepID=UPI0030EE53AC